MNLKDFQAERSNKFDNVAHILHWQQEDNYYMVSVQFRDGIEGHYAKVINADWEKIKLSELEFELNEENIPQLKQSRKGPIQFYKMNSEHFGLCAWCKSYYNRTNNQNCFPKLSDAEFEEINSTGNVSHTMCPNCKDNLAGE